MDKMTPSTVTFIDMVDRARMWRIIASYYRTSHPHHMCKRRIDIDEDTRCTTCKLYDETVLKEADIRKDDDPIDHEDETMRKDQDAMLLKMAREEREYGG